MFVLKSTHDGRIRALEIQLDQAIARINTLEADSVRLLHHLCLRKIDTPATPAGFELVAADSAEAKAADARIAALQESWARNRAALQNSLTDHYPGYR